MGLNSFCIQTKHSSILEWLRHINPEHLVSHWVADGVWHAVQGDGGSQSDGFSMETMESHDHHFHVRVSEHGKVIKELAFKELPKFAKILEELLLHVR
jgi:hypothetical protein